MKRIEELKISDPATARREEDWVAWRKAPHFNATIARAFALGLHRDPSRSKTHIIMQEAFHVPGQTDVRYKFRIGRAGIFRVTDAAGTIEECLGLGVNEGEAWIHSEVKHRLAGQSDDILPVILSVQKEDSGEICFTVGTS